MHVDSAELWRLLPIGYCLSVVLETPVLLAGLSPHHSLARKLLAGLWLTACTYPIVMLVLPLLIWQPLGDRGYWPYIAVAEIFAPAAECILFWLAFSHGPPSAQIPGNSRAFTRDMLAIIAANLVSFLLGSWLLSAMST